MLQEINKRKARNLYEYIKEYFNVKKIDFDEILNIVLKSKNDNDSNHKYKIWLLKLYINSLTDFNDTYLHLIFNSLKEYSYYSFTKLYFLNIFDLKDYDRFISERLKGLKILLKDENSDIYEDLLLNKIKDMPSEIIYKCITGLTYFEKELIVKNIINYKNISLDSIYPELDYYVKDELIKDSFINEEIYDYIVEYKKSKINNTVTDKFKQLINTLNNDSESFYKWYYSYKDIKDFINDKIDEVIQIDALGIEFASLLLNILQDENENYLFNLHLAKVNLPSITEVNKIDKAVFIRDLDQFIHNENYYSYPKTLIKEIEIIAAIARKISEKFKLGKKNILITGDHGLSVFGISQFLGKKRYNFNNAEHGGRYVKLQPGEIYSECEDYIVYEYQGNSYLVPIKHVSLFQIPRGESHGGATPEEVLVPVIIAKYTERKENEVYKIVVLNSLINIKEPVITFTVDPFPPRLPVVIIENKKYNTEFDKNINKYQVNLSKLKSGKKLITIKIGSYQQDFEIVVKGGMEVNDLL